jgi:hypothetical protein
VKRKDDPVPKILPLLFMLIGIALGLTGCNSEASQQAEAQRHLDAARATLSQANAGYVPQSQQSNGLRVYRQETMDAAFAELNKVMALKAPQQQLQALRMSAEIDSSAAIHAAGEAAAENAVLAARSTSLLGYLSALEGTAIRAAALEPQTAESLAKLNEEIERQTARQDQYSGEVSDLATKLQAVVVEIQKFKDLADEGNANAQSLREEAFVSQGNHMYDLQDQAAKIERQAAIESAAAEQEQVIATDLSGRLNMAQAQLDTANQLLTELAEQVKKTRADTARLADESAKALASNDEAAKVMAEEFNQIVDAHNSAVQERMTLAGQKTDKAVADLVKAVGIAGKHADRGTAAQDVKMTRLQLLTAYVDQAYVASSHATYLDDLASTTSSLASSAARITPQDAGVYKDQADQLAQAQATLNGKAAQAIEAGQELARELAPEGTTPEDGQAEAIALKQLNRLAAYAQRSSEQVVQ